jgi:hypothetical protein
MYKEIPKISSGIGNIVDRQAEGNVQCAAKGLYSSCFEI